MVPVVVAQKGVLKYPEFGTKELLGDDIFSDEYLASCDGCPFVVDHPTDEDGNPVDVNGENYKEHLDGILFAPTIDKVNNRVLGKVKIFNPVVADAVERGDLRELSQGYNCKVQPYAGNYQGETYNRVQSDIVMNHIALVEEGRAGDAVKILYNNRAGVKLVPALKEDVEKFERRRENMSKRNNVDEQTTTGKPNPQNTVNEDPAQQEAEDNRMSALEQKVESLATAVAQLVEKIGGTQNAEPEGEEGEDGKKKPTENAEGEDKDKANEKEVMNRVTNSVVTAMPKMIAGYMSELQNAAAQAAVLLGEDAQDLGHRLNDLSAYRKEVLKRTNTFSDAEIKAMSDSEAKATLAVLTKTAKVRINSASEPLHGSYTEHGDRKSVSHADF